MRKIFSLFALIICLSFSLFACSPTNIDVVYPDTIKNVIVVIGDGMGFNHIANAKTYFDDSVFAFDDYFTCPVTTHSLNSKVTDSAAAASALATGNKVYNRNISKFNGKNLKNLMEIAIENNKKTGIITSDNLYGATPACYSSHANHRNDRDDIISGQANSKIDVLIGAMDSEDTYAKYQTQFQVNNYKYVTSEEELLNTPSNQKIIANLNGLRSPYNTSITGQGAFNNIVQYILNYLDNENGFCLMIENAYIDKCSHSNDLYGALCEVKLLSDIVNTILNFCSNRNDTALIVTADHETGGLRYTSDKNKINNSLYAKSGHTSANVPLYLKGCSVSGYKKTIDNTDIFKICETLISKA